VAADNVTQQVLVFVAAAGGPRWERKMMKSTGLRWRGLLLASGAVGMVLGILGEGAAATPPPQSNQSADAKATHEQIMAGWAGGVWDVQGGYSLLGFAGEEDYHDLSKAPPNPAPLTPAAQAAYNKARKSAAAGTDTVDNLDCYHGLPVIAYSFYFEILPTKNRLTTLHFDTEIRRIYLDGRPHPKEFPLPQHTGHSIAHWEGNTLVIDTVNLMPNLYIEPGLAHSDQLHMIERWTPVSKDRINAEITLIDPKTFTRPWTVSRYFTRSYPQDQELSFLDYACENNKYIMKDGKMTLIGPDGKPLN
jgi:hypothetical protein